MELGVYKDIFFVQSKTASKGLGQWKVMETPEQLGALFVKDSSHNVLNRLDHLEEQNGTSGAGCSVSVGPDVYKT